MTKRIMLLILFVLIKINCFCQNVAIDENPNITKDLVKEDLKGKVKNVIISVYQIKEKFGEPTDFSTSITNITFNQQGNYLSKDFNCGTELKDLDIRNCSNIRELYRYDEESNCKSYYSYIKVGNRYENYNIDYVCSEGSVQKSNYTSDNSKGSYNLYSYDNKKNVTKIECYDKSNTIFKILQYSYNSNNKIIEEKIFNSDGILKEKHVYNYDVKGKMILKQDYLKDYTLDLIKSSNFTYDEKNNVINYDGFFKDVTKVKRTSPFGFNFKYLYDSKGNITELTESIDYRGIRKITKYYNYDSKSNWSEKVVCSSKGIPEYKEKRVIEYFDSTNDNNFLKSKSDKKEEKQDKEKLIKTINLESNIDLGVEIGNQIWTKDNLNVSYFNNGDKLIYAKTRLEWDTACEYKKAAFCYTNFDPLNEKKYGKLYNWYAINDARKLAPVGWHIPNDKEWDDLTESLGGYNLAGFKLKSSEGWLQKNGDNSSEFNAFPAGHINQIYEQKIGFEAWFWSIDQKETENSDYIFVNYRELDGNGNDFSPSKFTLSQLKNKKTIFNFGMSVRCIKD